MVDYNTHGGYFAPQGLLKINEGGSHEENPNGGIQLGVDDQGIPNLVEEDEMVYKDFVYSDNIKADGGFLEKNNLPTKYAGKFYSEIAEALCDEIGEQIDPISLNGLNASLGRLAGAQEEQKAAEEEAELMKALQQMSPEDLAMLEQALMEQQAPEQPMMPEEQMQPEMMPEEAVPEQIAPAVPMMAMGGKIFRDGGDEDDPPYQAPLLFNPETGSAYAAGHAYAPVGEIDPAVVSAYGPNPVRDAVWSGTDSFARNYGLPFMMSVGNPLGLALGEGVNAGVNVATGGEKSSVGDLVVDPEEHPFWNMVADATLNPGYAAAGLFGVTGKKIGADWRHAGKKAVRSAASSTEESAKKLAEKTSKATDLKASKIANENKMNQAMTKYEESLERMDNATSKKAIKKELKIQEKALQEAKEANRAARSDRWAWRGSKIKEAGAKASNAFNKGKEKVVRGVTGNKAAPVVQEAENAAGAAANVPTTTNTTPTVAKKGRVWPWLTAAGLTGGYVAIDQWNKHHGETDAVKAVDTQDSNYEASPVTLDEFFNLKARGGRIYNKYENGTRYGRTPDGQLVQIVERTDGNGTTWQDYIPVEESGSIDPATISLVDLPEVSVTRHGSWNAPNDSYYYFGSQDNRYNDVLKNYLATQPSRYGNNLLNMAYSNWLNHHSRRGYGNGIQYVPQGTGENVVSGELVDYPQPMYLGELDNVDVVGTNPGSSAVNNTTYRRGNGAAASPQGTPTTSTRNDWGDTIAKLGPIENKARNSGIIEGMLPYIDGSNLQGPGIVSNAGSELNGYSDWAGDRFSGSDGESGSGSSATDNPFDWRLMSPIMDSVMGLATAATPADHYDYNPIRPYLPYGRIRQQYERYNPLDINLVTNKMQAQANAVMAALRNAGIGPSTGAQIIGADAVAGQNLGNVMANVLDANNQRNNQVITQHNAADQTKAQFDWGVDSARANVLNQFAPYNQRIALQTEVLNNQAEQDKFNALAGYYNSAKKFFGDYGSEEIARDMVNTDRSNLGYGYAPGRIGRVVYDQNGNPIGRLGKCGGTLLKNHKKK